MSSATSLRVRRSLAELQNDHATGNPKPLDDLMRAWMGIKALKFDDPRSFFNLGGYHGEPFRGAGWADATFWGGYCNHGNVLFPTWHRVYCLKLEEALQSIAGCADVMLPYWDETAPETLEKGIPACLTDEFYTFADGTKVSNPLRSFVFPMRVADHITSDNNVYTKPAGYETVRYPLSGLVGTPADQAATDAHNRQYPDPATNAGLLNANVVNWMQHRFKNGQLLPIGVQWEFEQCLNAPNFTVFSNTTSAQEWNDTTGHEKQVVTPLEQPHNDIHLAVGGFNLPGQPDFSPIAGANGDMGENDTAALDPIFYFHHCNIDRVFWMWQKRHNATDRLELIEFYPGTNTSDSQGATPGFAPNTWLNLESPLNPFKKQENDTERTYISLDCINIERQLGYTYSRGSLDVDASLLAAAPAQPTFANTLHVSRINKAPLRGSFIVAAYHNTPEGQELIGFKSVLSRWDSGSCINCQTHLEVKAAFPIPAETTGQLLAATANPDNFSIELITRDHNLPNASRLAALRVEKPYRLEVR